MMENYTKTDSWLQKSHEKFGKLQTGSGKSNKLKFDWLILSKKCFLSAKALYTDLTTLLSTTYSPNSEITYVIFETRSHSSRHYSSVFVQLEHYIISAKVVHQNANFQTSHCSH